MRSREESKVSNPLEQIKAFKEAPSTEKLCRFADGMANDMPQGLSTSAAYNRDLAHGYALEIVRRKNDILNAMFDSVAESAHTRQFLKVCFRFNHCTDVEKAIKIASQAYDEYCSSFHAELRGRSFDFEETIQHYTEMLYGLMLVCALAPKPSDDGLLVLPDGRVMNMNAISAILSDPTRIILHGYEIKLSLCDALCIANHLPMLREQPLWNIF